MQLRPSAPSPAGRPHLWSRPGPGRREGRLPDPRWLALGVLLFIPAAIALRLAIHHGGPVAWAAMILMPIAAGFAGYWMGRLSRKRAAPDRE